MDIDVRLGNKYNIPIDMIRRLKDELPHKSNDTINVEITDNYPQSSTYRVRVEGITNRNSSFGDFYVKKSVLNNYLKQLEDIDHNNLKAKDHVDTYVIIKYSNRNGLTKILNCTIDCNIGDYLVLESKSSKFAIAEVVGKINIDNRINSEYYFDVFDRKIVCKVN